MRYFLSTMLFFTIILSLLSPTLCAQSESQAYSKTATSSREIWIKYLKKNYNCEENFCTEKMRGPFSSLEKACEEMENLDKEGFLELRGTCEEALNKKATLISPTKKELHESDYQAAPHLSDGVYQRKISNQEGLLEYALIRFPNFPSFHFLLLKTKKGWFFSNALGKIGGGAMGVSEDLFIKQLQVLNLIPNSSQELLIEMELDGIDSDMGLNGISEYTFNTITICSATEDIPQCTPRLLKHYSYSYSALQKEEAFDKKLEVHKKSFFDFHYNKKNGSLRTNLKKGKIPNELKSIIGKEIKIEDLWIP